MFNSNAVCVFYGSIRRLDRLIRWCWWFRYSRRWLLVRSTSSEGGLLDGLGNGWPATNEAGVVSDGWVQGGVRGWSRSMQFPVGSLVGPENGSPWELRRFHALRGIGL